MTLPSRREEAPLLEPPTKNTVELFQGPHLDGSIFSIEVCGGLLLGHPDSATTQDIATGSSNSIRTIRGRISNEDLQKDFQSL